MFVSQNMEIDWKRYIICQEITHEPLKCPMYTVYGIGRSCDKMTDAYESLLANVKRFSDLNALPTKIHFQSNPSALQCIMLLGTNPVI